MRYSTFPLNVEVMLNVEFSLDVSDLFYRSAEHPVFSLQTVSLSCVHLPQHNHPYLLVIIASIPGRSRTRCTGRCRSSVRDSAGCWTSSVWTGFTYSARSSARSWRRSSPRRRADRPGSLPSCSARRSSIRGSTRRRPCHSCECID